MAEAPTCWEEHLALTAARYRSQSRRLEAMGESYAAMRLRMITEDIEAHAARLQAIAREALTK